MKLLKLTKVYISGEKSDVHININKITHINRGEFNTLIYVDKETPIEVSENVDNIISKINELINNT